jgi:uncharacterized protein (DUF427 family)
VSLTSGRGPFGRNPAGRFVPPLPQMAAYLEPFRRRVRAVRDGQVIVDSESVLLLHRPGEAPAFAFPREHVKGDGATPVPEAEGYVCVPWESADSWFEEDQEVFFHPRNPYHRVDYIPTSRWLRVEVDGVVLVDTHQTVGVYETSLEPRLYVSRDQLNGAALSPSTKRTYCPYKGVASYWHATVNGAVVEDLAWSYEDPLDESQAIRGMLCFDDAVVTVKTDLPAAASLSSALRRG